MELVAINQQHAYSLLPVYLRELAIFLSIMMRKGVGWSDQHTSEWTRTIDASPPVSEVRRLGYVELNNVGMPTAGRGSTVPLTAVGRPDLSPLGNSIALTEQPLPNDIIDLWRIFDGLDTVLRQKLRRAGNLYQLAMSLGHEHETTSFVLLVCACEALKPSSPDFRDRNAYDVIGATLGIGKVDLLRTIGGLEPDAVRHAHLHLGEFRGSEFTARSMNQTYADPTFGQAHSVLAKLTPAVLANWLARRGELLLLPAERRRRMWTWTQRHAWSAVLIAPVAGFALAFLVIAVFRVRGATR
jgi:hypothetical protein